MSWKKNHALRSKLYCIIDKDAIGNRDAEEIAKFLLKSGVKIIQLRYKNYPAYKLALLAKRINRIAKPCGAVVLVDDRVDSAFACNADGAHVGRGDLPLKRARFLLGNKKILGRTIHSLKEVSTSNAYDYFGVGPVYKTPVKKKLRAKGTCFPKRVKANAACPVFAIGGINRNNFKDVLKTGVDGICVTRAIFDAKYLLKEIKSDSN